MNEKFPSGLDKEEVDKDPQEELKRIQETFKKSGKRASDYNPTNPTEDLARIRKIHENTKDKEEIDPLLR